MWLSYKVTDAGKMHLGHEKCDQQVTDTHLKAKYSFTKLGCTAGEEATRQSYSCRALNASFVTSREFYKKYQSNFEW